MKAINTEDFKVTGKFDVRGAATFLDAETSDKKIADSLEEVSIKLGKLQDKMYANKPL